MSKRQHQVIDDRTMAYRPGGQIEALHCAAPNRRIFWAGPQGVHPGGHHELSAVEARASRRCCRSPGVARRRVAATPDGCW